MRVRGFSWHLVPRARDAKQVHIHTHTHSETLYPIPKALSPYQKKTFCILLSSDQSALSSHSKYGEEMNEIPLEANFNWINRSFYHLGVLQLLKLAWCLVALKFRKARSSYLFCSLMDPPPLCGICFFTDILFTHQHLEWDWHMLINTCSKMIESKGSNGMINKNANNWAQLRSAEWEAPGVKPNGSGTMPCSTT